MYRWQIIIKGNFQDKDACNIKKLVYDSIKTDYNNIRVSMDINPTSLL